MEENMEWIDLAECKERWQALVDAVMNFRFPEFLDWLRIG
jgi:hypothetical protein